MGHFPFQRSGPGKEENRLVPARKKPGLAGTSTLDPTKG